MIRLLRGIGALAILSGVMIGAPVALLAWGRGPSGWSGLLRPDDGSLLLVVLTAVGWVAWALFTAATTVESVRLLAGVSLRVPLLGGLQQVSAGLLLAVLALAPASASAEAPPAPSLTVTVPLAVSDTKTVAEPAEISAGAEDDGYLVAAGDDLWGVSETLLGDGGRWREIVAANPERLQDPTARLAPGTRLALPATAPKQVVVERGDTLSGIALERLGTANRWPAIAAANADLIDDPDHIEVGWRLDLPSAQHASRGAEPSLSRDGDAQTPQADDQASAGDESETSGPDGSETRANPSAEPADATTLPEPGGPRAGEGEAPEPAQAAASTTLPAPVEGSEAAHSQDTEPDDDQTGLPAIGVFGSLAAAAVIGVLETRRYLRLRSRPVGRRLLPATEPATRLRTAIGGRQRPDRMAALDKAMRAIGEHCFRNHLALPELERVALGETTIGFHWAGSAGAPPSGFSGDRTTWRFDLAPDLDPSDWPSPYPALVSLGTTETGETQLVDAERSRVLGVATGSEELRRSTLAAMGVELACAPWSQDVQLVVTGDDTELLTLAGGDRVRVKADPHEAIAELRTVVSARRSALGDIPLATLRVDPDRADAVTPIVFLLNTAADPATTAELDGLLAGQPTGVVVLLGTDSVAPALWHVGGDPYAPSGRLAGQPGSLLAHSIPEATRTGVASLLSTADDPTDTPAPWWGDPTDNVRPLPQRAHRGEEPMDIVRLLPAPGAPQVMLIGPTELVGASGPEPLRSRQQLIEVCAWLLEHPGSSATEMSAGLSVAEGTRRSNLSRLRAWLGTDPTGALYLPDAYTGRIRLHPAVTSDWEQLQLLLRPGADRVADAVLVAALELVRGAPLADATPVQWHWAEVLRTDMTSALRDVGMVLADRALANGDIDLARWAASRALVVAPDDEQLLCARIRTEHRAGNRPEVERLVNQVARQSRVLGVDLLPETVELCQQVIEGRLRAQRA